MVTGLLFDIRKYSINDGPGIRTTLFFKGCPLNCWWCHNPESQSPSPEIMLRAQRCIACGACIDVCPECAITSNNEVILTNRQICKACGTCISACTAEAREWVGFEITSSDVMDIIRRDIPFYEESGGGVTFSGGEPLFQPDFLSELLELCHHDYIHTTLDTCGYAAREIIEQIAPQVDLFLYDLKIMDDRMHQRYTGVSNQIILENLSYLSDLGSQIIVRIPIVPGINDDQENIEWTAKYLSGLPNLLRIDILPFHNSGFGKYNGIGRSLSNEILDLTKIVALNDERMEQIADTIRGHHLQVRVG
jgi:pyruvate formate lyase activating enzyme